MSNVQNLPAGMPSITQASAPQIPAPAPAPVPAPAPTQPVQYLQQPPTQPDAALPPLQQHHNPMLTSIPAPPPVAPAAPAAPAPAAPPAPAEPPKPATPPATGTVADLAGALGTDPMIAPSVAFLEAQSLAAGLDVTRAFGNAADELDARFIDRAYLVEKVGQAQADQLIKVAESTIQYAATARDNLFNECRAVAGEAGAWDQAIALFNQHADPQTRAALAAAFDSMNRDQMLYAAKQIVDFARNTGGMVQGGAQPLGSPTAGTGMSSDEYRAAVAALPRNATDAQYEALRQARALGQKQGR